MSEENTTPGATPPQNAEPANPYLAAGAPAQHPGQPVHITNQVIIVQQKSMAVAYLLWFFLGQLGIHKFYLNKTGMGIAYLLLGIVGWATTVLLIGWAILAVLWIMLVIDLFTIPGSVESANRHTAAGIRY